MIAMSKNAPSTEESPGLPVRVTPTGVMQVDENEVRMDMRTLAGFKALQRAATLFSESALVPEAYRKNMPNCLIALNISARIGADPLMVMQNLYIVHGTPSWAGKFSIAAVNACGRFTALRFEKTGEDVNAPSFGMRAWATEKSTGERLNGPWVTWETVKAEKWQDKPGSKWKTMAELMFMYRCGAWWGRAYAPELTMGLQTVEEVEDVGPEAALTSDRRGLDLAGALERAGFSESATTQETGGAA
jgi:hypothetical protein